MAKKLFHKQELGLGIRALLTNIDNEEYKNRCCLFKSFLWNVCGVIFLFLWFFILLVIFYGYIDTENLD